jgi:hypothetical protein
MISAEMQARRLLVQRYNMLIIIPSTIPKSMPKTGQTKANTLHQRLRSHILLITLATQPAPNPLSIFTTLTFEAQLFNIARSAVNPPKLEP